ncbi:hypothetical protein KCU65_g5536, partial [Aureobasidium melanogenum]
MRSDKYLHGAIVAFTTAVHAATPYSFIPNMGGLDASTYVDVLPLEFNFTTSQLTTEGYIGSWWSSFYLTGAPGVGVYRGSILDVHDPSIYSQFSYVTNGTDAYFANAEQFNLTFPGFYYG